MHLHVDIFPQIVKAFWCFQISFSYFLSLPLLRSKSNRTNSISWISYSFLSSAFSSLLFPSVVVLKYQLISQFINQICWYLFLTYIDFLILIVKFYIPEFPKQFFCFYWFFFLLILYTNSSILWGKLSHLFYFIFVLITSKILFSRGFFPNVELFPFNFGTFYLCLICLLIFIDSHEILLNH